MKNELKNLMAPVRRETHRERLSRMYDDDPLNIKSWIITYKRKIYLVQGDSYKVITDAEVRKQLLKNTDTKLVYICAEQVCPMPPAFVGKNPEAAQVKDDAEAIAYILKLTGVTITL